MTTEAERILGAYKRRDERREAGPRFHAYESVAHVYRVHERHALTLRLLADGGYGALGSLRILDVGCGDGNMLRQFLQWGADPPRLAGIDLRPTPIERARHLNPGFDLRCGSATELPWPDASFNIVCQHTVFTSVLDPSMKAQLAREMQRVLMPGGAVLWYDFIYDNPRNKDVRGVGAREIRTLFPELQVRLVRTTLAPPIARRIPVPALAVLYPALSAFPFLRTHYLGLFVKPRRAAAEPPALEATHAS